MKHMRQLKFNWGYGIAVLYCSFAIGIIFLVYKCTQHPVDLISADYYNREIKFQQQYDKMENAASLSAPMKFNVDANSKSVTVEYPVSAGTKNLTGSIYFMRPDDATLDKNISIAMNDSRQQLIDYSNWKKGLYRVEVNWNDGAKDYYKQSFLKLN